MTNIRDSVARFGSLVWIAVGVAIAATAASTWILYRAALSAEIDRVGEIAYGQARLVEAVADFDSVESQDAHPEGALYATLQQVADGNQRWLRRQPGIELAMIMPSARGFTTLVRQGQLVPNEQRTAPLPFAPQAIHEALQGRSGALRGESRDGRDVITGYAWMPERGIAMLAQIPTERTRQPFVQALLLSGFAALLVIGVGMLAFRKRGLPLLADLQRELSERREAEAKLAEHQQQLEQLVLARTEELRRAQGELVKTERLAPLGKLTATVSHELRNPLGTLRNSLYSIEERTRGKALDLERVLARAHRSAERCDAIIDELLTFSRNKPPKPERIELGSWLREAVADYEVPGGFAMECNTIDDAWVEADPEDLRRCLINLLSNAAHATAAADRTPANGRIRINTVRSAGMIELRVEDNGTGMSSEVRAHLFEPLFSTKGFGVGLGLCIVRDLIDKNHGEIAFTNLPGGGTRAALSLPAAAQPLARAMGDRP